VDVRNEGDVETTVHWHGLRLENRYDGVPRETQAPIPVGGAFTYKVQSPDAGFYWYHPHMREDLAGRFLILSRDGLPKANLVWKDTVLLRETVDILLYVTNPGLWMAYCHIAEHTESAMMLSFEVKP
jgi:FtsP/CotA-like multicopper oxidase with cupredoxin domain